MQLAFIYKSWQQTFFLFTRKNSLILTNRNVCWQQNLCIVTSYDSKRAATCGLSSQEIISIWPLWKVSVLVSFVVSQKLLIPTETLVLLRTLTRIFRVWVTLNMKPKCWRIHQLRPCKAMQMLVQRSNMNSQLM